MTAKMTTMMMSRLLSKHLLKLMLLTWALLGTKAIKRGKLMVAISAEETPTAKMAPLKRMPEMSWMPMSMLETEWVP